MILTDKEIAILAHVVINPQEWADHAAETVSAQAVTDKIEKYRASYLAEKDLPGYLTRAQKEVAF